MLKILLDIDGVLANWEEGAGELFGLTFDEVVARWPKGEFNIEKAVGATEEEVWRRIDDAGEDWWVNLREYPWSRKLYDTCRSIAPVYFVTSPSRHPSSLSGKLKWMHNFTGDRDFRNYLVGPKKYLCARESQILVDDSDKNVREFREHGGFGILFPRQNNAGYAWGIDDPCEFVLPQIAAISDVFRTFKSPQSKEDHE